MTACLGDSIVNREFYKAMGLGGMHPRPKMSYCEFVQVPRKEEEE